jgi:hypothetical protein
VLETVPDGIAGVLYAEPDERDLAEAIDRFEAIEGSISAPMLQAQAAKFSDGKFFAAVSAVLDRSSQAVGLP